MLPGNGCPVKGFLIAGTDLREIALAHQRRRHAVEGAGERIPSQALVGAHEERLVVTVVEFRNHHRPVRLDGELVPPPGILRQRRVVEVPPFVERIILERVGQRAVQPVGAALGDDVDVHAEVGAVFRRGAAGLDLDRFHRIGDGPHARRRQQVGRGVDAVERQAVLDLPLTGAAEAQADIAVEAAQHPRRGARQRPDVASARRQVHDGSLADGFRDHRAVGREDLGSRLDIHRLGEPADLHHRVRADDLVVRDLHPGGLEALEARHGDGDLVGARAHELDVVIALRIGRRLVGILRAHVDGNHLRARHHEVAGIGDGAHERGLGCQLRGRTPCEAQPQTQGQRCSTYHPAPLYGGGHRLRYRTRHSGRDRPPRSHVARRRPSARRRASDRPRASSSTHASRAPAGDDAPRSCPGPTAASRRRSRGRPLPT